MFLISKRFEGALLLSNNIAPCALVRALALLLVAVWLYDPKSQVKCNIKSS